MVSQKQTSSHFFALVSFLVCTRIMISGFLVSDRQLFRAPNTLTTSVSTKESLQSPSALSMWWFGGTEDQASESNGESCELVAVRIERTSSNSRRIAGEITVPTPMQDVWAILTDYNRLATHVPNLMESKMVKRQTPNGKQGDGSFRCRLFQRGAQKIIGFEFGASVTMDMTEQFVRRRSRTGTDELVQLIKFKCVDSQFFSEFDGEWRVSERIGPDGSVESVVSYVVDVRPKGPVPVAALEWRIREDVPTNLRAVKQAATAVGKAGVEASRLAVKSLAGSLNIAWDSDETMAAYLK